MTPCHHAWTMLEKLDHCEIDEADSIKHTAIVLIGCITCRMVYPFPAQNAALITERYLATIRADLARQGWTWVADNPEES